MLTPTVVVRSVGGEGYPRFEYGWMVPGHDTRPIPSMPFTWPTGLTRIAQTAHGPQVNDVSIKPPWFYSVQQLFYEIRRTQNTLPTQVATYQDLGTRLIVGAPTMRDV